MKGGGGGGGGWGHIAQVASRREAHYVPDDVRDLL